MATFSAIYQGADIVTDISGASYNIWIVKYPFKFIVLMCILL